MSILPLRSAIYTPARLGSKLAVLLVLAVLWVAHPYFTPPPPPPASPSLSPGFGILPLSFIPNADQTDPAVRFQAHGAGGMLFFTPDQVVLSLPGTTADGGQRLSLVRLRFEGADPALQITGADRLPGLVNYFIGNDPAGWQTELPTYAEIVYQGLYPGIDLHYTGTAETMGNSLSLKGTYTLAPGAAPAHIRWRYQGAATSGAATPL